MLGLSFRPIFHFLFVLIDQHVFSFSLNRVFSFCYFFFFRCKVMIRFDDGFKPESGLFGRVFFFFTTSGRSSAGGGGDGARRSRKRP